MWIITAVLKTHTAKQPTVMNAFYSRGCKYRVYYIHIKKEVSLSHPVLK
jgi:hypothetical protein